MRAKFDAKLTGIRAYGRAFVNDDERNGRIVKVPEIMIIGKKHYLDTLLNSKITGLSFFVAEDDLDNSSATYLTTNVDIYFAVNLKKLYPIPEERAVEYLHRDVLNLLDGTKFNNTKVVVKDPFSEFDPEIGDNMQPFYLVRFETKIEYSINEC
jgi:hypothetical protein